MIIAKDIFGILRGIDDDAHIVSIDFRLQQAALVTVHLCQQILRSLTASFEGNSAFLEIFVNTVETLFEPQGNLWS